MWEFIFFFYQNSSLFLRACKYQLLDFDTFRIDFTIFRSDDFRILTIFEMTKKEKKQIVRHSNDKIYNKCCCEYID